MHPELVAALDIGGTKIAGALVDGDGKLRARSRRPTPAQSSGEEVAAAVVEVLDELAGAPEWERVGGIGIGSAGPVDASAGTVSPVNIPGWRGYPLVEQLRERAPGLPVTLVGDGPAIAAAEHWQGAAQGRRTALCMVVSTGVGGGLVLDGRLYPGPTGNAGHIGHISVDFNGELCPCGSRGCVERIASGPNIARTALDRGWQPPAGSEADAGAVAASARAGDEAARGAYLRAARALAAGIAATATLVEVEITVIGGGVAAAGEVLFDPLRAALREYATLSYLADLEIAGARTGNDAGLIGAAAACWDQLR